MRGRAKPALRMQASVSFSARWMRSPDSFAATSLSGMCEVTRAFQSSPSTLNSLAGVFSPATSAENAISSS